MSTSNRMRTSNPTAIETRVVGRIADVDPAAWNACVEGDPFVSHEFLHALEVHNESAALPVLARIATLIACGDRDLLTPVKHSEEMAAVLPDSELVIVAGAGHLVQLERPEVINDALLRLVERSTDA